MLITLHKNATTTLAVRAAIQQSSASGYELVRQYGVTRDTIRRWRKRGIGHDASHTPHRLQTMLNAAQEKLVIYLCARICGCRRTICWLWCASSSSNCGPRAGPSFSRPITCPRPTSSVI